MFSVLIELRMAESRFKLIKDLLSLFYLNETEFKNFFLNSLSTDSLGDLMNMLMIHSCILSSFLLVFFIHFRCFGSKNGQRNKTLDMCYAQDCLR